MKGLIKFLCSFVCYVMFFVCSIALSLCATWYLLPKFSGTLVGQLILQWCGSEQTIAIISIVIALLTLFFFIMGKVFVVINNSKALNFYTHLLSWTMAIVLSIESIYSFVASESISTQVVELGAIRKVGIIACVVSMLIYMIVSPKVRTIVDRRIQAYDTAKELNVNGRSSVVGMQILKCLDFVCPEIFLLLALCFAFDWSISLYFIYIICSFVLPIVGNMICDKRVKLEAERTKIEERDVLVSEIANAIQEQQHQAQ